MDWKEIEQGFKELLQKARERKEKNRIESDISVSNRIPPLTEEEKNEFYTTNITEDIKPNYGK